MILQELAKPCLAVFFAFGVKCLGNAIGKQQQALSFFEPRLARLKARLFGNAEDNRGRGKALQSPAIAYEERGVVTRVHVAQVTGGQVELSEKERDQAVLRNAAAEVSVELRDQLRTTKAGRNHGAKSSLKECHQKGRQHSFAGDISNDHPDVVRFRQLNDVIVVATD